MSNDRNTLERMGSLRSIEAGADIHAGAMVAVNSSGKAVPAADAAGLTVLGRASTSVKTGERVCVKAGTFAFDTPSGVTPTVADIGRTVFVHDDHTVAFTGTTHAIKAGVVFDVDDEGVWITTGWHNHLVLSELPPLSADVLPDLSGTYLEVPVPASETEDVELTSVTGADGSEAYAAGEGSANLMADLLAIKGRVNAVLAVLRSNGFITEA